MATIILGAVGGAIGSGIGGSVLGLSAAALGQAAGATIGNYLDQRLLGVGSNAVETGRVDRLRLTGASEGAPVPRIWGRTRVGGQVIWASRFIENTEVSRIGGSKTGTQVTQYSYSVNLAIALCEGEIVGVGRVWADGAELATDRLVLRVYHGGEDQLPDPRIEAIEGAGRAPAYRGIAYVVIEDLDLAPFGNRVPQFTFEVLRSAAGAEVPDLMGGVRAVALIPGTGEAALSTEPAATGLPGGALPELPDVVMPALSAAMDGTRPINVNTATGRTDIEVALGQLTTDLPNCRSVLLVVSWFGDDLRCGDCRVRPKVELTEGGPAWHVAGLDREAAELLPTLDGRVVYGGTPSDHTVREGIAALRAAGQEVVFYPFLLMGQMQGNALPDPWTGATGQPALPWRGRITASVAPGRPGTPDRSAEAAAQVAAFFGAAQPEHFALAGDRVIYTGPADDWGFRRFILHYAWLAKAAGGVDAFCVGSEMRGLTHLRGAGDSFPAVAAFRQLAAEVRAILGASVKISYAADWSEYFGYMSPEGTHYFHLDDFWADENVDFIGIDNYLPMSDWRDGHDHLDAQAGWHSVHDLDYLQANIEGGEHFDWYYRDEADRHAQIRTPIEDGAEGAPWRFRPKDLRAWWSNPHGGGVAAPVAALDATGGEVTEVVQDGVRWRVHVFRQSGTLSVQSGGEVEYLVVGGGGGGSGQGGGGASGGGGAGGLLKFVAGEAGNSAAGPLVLAPGSYAVTVGGGGQGESANRTNGTLGTATSLAGLVAMGGGHGGANALDGAVGGSGGGGGAGLASFAAGGAGTPGQGHAGGVADNSGSPVGGGGGGAGGPGAAGVGGVSGGAGGGGVRSAITGEEAGYAGGGGGGGVAPALLGDAADGGGAGRGGSGLPAGDGMANTGGGGGGASTSERSGDGGTGIVVLRYRIDTVQTGSSPWVPESKPIWFTELGCPAVDRGTNQPNVFFDPKSSESFLPWYSDGRRDDAIQQQYHRAMIAHWGRPGTNPVSSIYGGPMVDMGRAHVWAWDARPFPAFPALTEVWSDGPNWQLGDWITGRSASQQLASVVAEICRRAGVTDFDVGGLHGLVRGLRVASTDSARSVLQMLMLAHGFDVAEREGTLVFAMRGQPARTALEPEWLGARDGGAVELVRAAEADVAGRVRIVHVEAEADFDIRAVEAALADDPGALATQTDLPLVLLPAEAQGMAERWLSEARVARDTLRLTLPPSTRLGAGDAFALDLPEGRRLWRIDRVDLMEALEVSAVRVESAIHLPSDQPGAGPRMRPFATVSPVLPVFLELPLLTGAEDPHAPHLAVTSADWSGPVAVYEALPDQPFVPVAQVPARAAMGVTQTGLPRAAPGRWDRGAPLLVRMLGAGLRSASPSAVLAGANAMAIGCGSAGPWEVFQFAEAELVGPDLWALSLRLRGQAGTAAVMPEVWPEGSMVVLLDAAPVQVPQPPALRGVARRYRIGPAALAHDGPGYVELEAAFEPVGLRPYAPAHLRARRGADGALDVDWIRRTRMGGDDWSGEDVPLGESAERYRLEIRQHGAVRRSVEVSAPHWTYDAEAQAQDGIAPPFRIAVAQVAPNQGPGPFTEIVIE